MDWSPLYLSLRIASSAMAIVVPIGLLTGWWMAQGRRFRGKLLVSTLLTVPIVLPPTAVGYMLLLALGRGTRFGRWLNHSAGVHLIFTWQGAALAAAIMAFPLFVRTATSAFSGIQLELLEAARSSGASEWYLFYRIALPICARSLLSGFALALGRALGEFGATLMVAGNIPGVTQTLPLALYSQEQAGNDHAALVFTVVLASTAMLLVGLSDALASRSRNYAGESTR